MRRVLACVLSLTIVAASGVASLLHTHAYGGHDHPEHHHGLAAHEHHAPAHPAHPAGEDESGVRVERCDPSQHVLSFAFIAAEPSQVSVGDAEIVLPSLPMPAVHVERAVEHREVRDNGPPLLTALSPRAPPLIALT